jgi:apolipoprotein N-acyltransferase
MRLKPFGLDVTALMAGASMLPAYSPHPNPTFAVAGFLMFILTLFHSHTQWQLFRRGFLFGIGLYGIGLYWLFVVADYVPTSFSPVITALNIAIILITCLYPASTAYILGFIKQQESNCFLLALPFTWTLGEWLRSWLLTGLPLYQLSHAFIDTPLSGFASIGGELTITLASATSITSLAGIFTSYKLERKFLFATLIVAILATGWFLQKITWTQEYKTITVRILHGTPNQQRKSKRYYAIDTIKEYLTRSKNFPLRQLVIWPESSVALDIQQVYKYLQNDSITLAQKGTSILLGSYMQDGLKTHNTLLLADNPNVRYFKRHLIPFGEYTPDWPLIALKQLLPNIENNHLLPGDQEQPTLIVNNIKVSPIICYELLFPNELRSSWQEADLLVFASDLNWFKNTWGLHQLFQASRLRAMESDKYLLASTSYGITSIIGHKGEVVKQISNNTPEKWLDAVVSLRTGTTPYTKYGNTFVLLLCFVGGAICIYNIKRRQTTRPPSP